MNMGREYLYLRFCRYAPESPAAKRSLLRLFWLLTRAPAVRRPATTGFQGIKNQRTAQFYAIAFMQHALRLAAFAIDAHGQRPIGEFGKFLVKSAQGQSLCGGCAFGHIQRTTPQARRRGKSQEYTHVNPRKPRGRAV